MDVFTDIDTYPEDPTRYLDFGRFAADAGDFVLVPGHTDFSKLDRFEGRRIVYLELEEPNRFMTAHPMFRREAGDGKVWRVLTICPYTAEWLNAKDGEPKRTPVFFPFNENYVPARAEKAFDVIYTGHILTPEIRRMVAAMERFNYRVVSHSPDDVVTDRDASYVEKLALIARARVTIVANLLFPARRNIRAVARVPGWRDNEAFRLVPSRHLPFMPRPTGAIVPQVKSRLFEAAFCGSLILCRRDPFNLVERFFEPNAEFIYFDSETLEAKLEHVLTHYDQYLPVISRARARAMRDYTTSAFFDQYLSTL